MTAGVLLIVLVGLLTSGEVLGQGINTNVALPVAEGEGIWRSQLRFRRATDDPSPLDRKLGSLVAPQTLVYGATARLSAFATVPILARKRLESGGSSDRDSAFGDLRLLARYMLFIDDYAPLSTRRAALLAGIKLPTGADRVGTPTYDPILGGVATWAANRNELDVDALMTLGTKRHGFESGSRLRYDIAYRLRLWPARFEGRLLQLNALLELNGIWMGRNRDHGSTVRDSGGHLLFASPGLQLAAVRWIAELSLQIPVVQSLHGDQLETDYIAVVSIRIPFSLY
jgi:hypothetical protein